MAFESRLGIRGHHRARVSASESDYAQPRCLKCGKRISDDRLDAKSRKDGDPLSVRYCSGSCGSTANQIKRGVGTGRGSTGRWRSEYDRATAANGEWIVVHCDTDATAVSLCASANNKSGLEAMRSGLAVSIRLVVAA